MDFQEKFFAGFLEQQLKSLSDDQLLVFIDQQVLTRLTPAQKVKLRDFINQKVASPEPIVMTAPRGFPHAR